MRKLLALVILLAGCVSPAADLQVQPPHPDGVDVAHVESRAPGRLDKAPGAVHAAIRSMFGGTVVGRGATNGQALVWDGTQLRWEPGTISTDIQALLDGIGSTRGSILYRGASGWAILAPGTSGHFLRSNGAGADPSYASAAEADTWATVLARGATTGTNSPTITSGQQLLFHSGSSSDVGLLRVTTAVTDVGLRVSNGASSYSQLVADYIGAGTGTITAYLGPAGVALGSAKVFKWVDDTDATAGTTDTQLARASAGLVDVLGTGTNQGSLRTLTLELGSAATDTTLARSGAGDLSVEGNYIYRAGGTDVPVTDGGTGASTAAGGFRALAEGIGSTQGNVLYRDGTQWVALGVGSSGQVLTSGGAGANVSWATPAGGGSPWILLTPQDGIQPAANGASFNVRNSHSILEFDQTTAESIIYEFAIPDSYASGSNLTFSGYVTSTATTGDYVFSVSIEYIDDGTLDIDADSFDTAAQASAVTTSGTAGVPTKWTVNLSNGAADDIVAGTLVRATIARVPGDAGDTMAADAQLLGVTVEQ